MGIKLEKIIQLDAEMEVVTGLRIGGSNARIEIGNVDNVVIKHPVSGKPYVPGSSLKGKLRTLCQYKENKVSDGGPWTLGDTDNKASDPILRIFGTSSEKGKEWEYGPSRLIVRDGYLIDDEKVDTKKSPSDYLEVKTEVAIDRLTGTAAKSGPRQMERVVAGTKFRVKFVYRVFIVDSGQVKIEDDEILFYKHIPQLLNYLEMDYLGGCGSRGYGKIEFKNFNLIDTQDSSKNLTQDKIPNVQKLIEVTKDRH